MRIRDMKLDTFQSQIDDFQDQIGNYSSIYLLKPKTISSLPQTHNLQNILHDPSLKIVGKNELLLSRHPSEK